MDILTDTFRTLSSKFFSPFRYLKSFECRTSTVALLLLLLLSASVRTLSLRLDSVCLTGAPPVPGVCVGSLQVGELVRGVLVVAVFGLLHDLILWVKTQ